MLVASWSSTRLPSPEPQQPRGPSSVPKGSSCPSVWAQSMVAGCAIKCCSALLSSVSHQPSRRSSLPSHIVGLWKTHSRLHSELRQWAITHGPIALPNAIVIVPRCSHQEQCSTPAACWSSDADVTVAVFTSKNNKPDEESNMLCLTGTWCFFAAG